MKDAEHAEDEDGVDGLDRLSNPHIGDVDTEIDRIVIEVSYPG
ncbi:hypothetical protein [Cryobacterium lyxosi]|nr:hypothetical protein [Cryobacterium lyxosi]